MSDEIPVHEDADLTDLREGLFTFSLIPIRRYISVSKINFFTALSIPVSKSA